MRLKTELGEPRGGRQMRLRAVLAWALMIGLAGGASRAAEPAGVLTPAMAASTLERLGAVAVPRGKDGTRIKNLLTVAGQPAKAGTEATLRWDDQGLTVVFECEDKDVKGEKRDRDAADIWKDDTVEVFLDPGRKRDTTDSTWMHVIVSAAGVEYDERGPVVYSKSSGDPQNADRSWNLPGLKVRTEKTKTGWRAEIIMPWDGLGGKPAAGEVWGFNLARANWPEEEFQCLSPTHGPFYNSDKWATLFFVEQPPDKNPSVLGGLFRELRVTLAPKGGEGVAFKEFRTLLDTPVKTPTAANIRWDDEGLTIAVDCEDKDIKAEERKRDDADQIWKDDGMEVFLDVGGQHDPRSDRWWHLTLNAAGSVADERGPMQWYPSEYNVVCGRIPATPKGGDGKLDLAELKTKAEKTKTGWRAEIFLSWKDLGAKPAAGEIWGFNLARNNWPGPETQCLAPTVAHLHNMERWGYLMFVEQPLALPAPTRVAPQPRPGKAPKPGENLVFNGGFDQELDGWTIFPAEGKPGSPRYKKDDEHQSEGKIVHPSTRKDVMVLSNPYGRAESRPFALDPAFRYRMSIALRDIHWSVRVFVDGYRWQPGVKPHDGLPKPEELQMVWRSRPLRCTVIPARNLREQKFSNNIGAGQGPGGWGVWTLDFPDPADTLYDWRTWSQVEFARVYLDCPMGGAGFTYGYVYVDDVKVERVE